MTTKPKYKKNPKYRVIPGLTPNGKELMQRLKNRSIVLEDNGDYSLDQEMDEARRLTKSDLRNKTNENKAKIDGLQKKINSQSNPKQSGT